MTTLVVATLFSTAFGQLSSPNPYSNTGCFTAWDCHGDSVYCYPGNPNYCSYGNGINSLCHYDRDCGWIGHGDRKRQLRCSSAGTCIVNSRGSSQRHRRAEILDHAPRGPPGDYRRAEDDGSTLTKWHPNGPPGRRAEVTAEVMQDANVGKGPPPCMPKPPFPAPHNCHHGRRRSTEAEDAEDEQEAVGGHSPPGVVPMGRRLPSAETLSHTRNYEAEGSEDGVIGRGPPAIPAPIGAPIGRGPPAIPAPIGRRAEVENAEGETDVLKSWNPCFLIPCPPELNVRDLGAEGTEDASVGHGLPPLPGMGRRRASAEVKDTEIVQDASGGNGPDPCRPRPPFPAPAHCHHGRRRSTEARDAEDEQEAVHELNARDLGAEGTEDASVGHSGLPDDIPLPLPGRRRSTEAREAEDEQEAVPELDARDLGAEGTEDASVGDGLPDDIPLPLPGRRAEVTDAEVMQDASFGKGPPPCMPKPPFPAPHNCHHGRRRSTEAWDGEDRVIGRGPPAIPAPIGRRLPSAEILSHTRNYDAEGAEDGVIGRGPPAIPAPIGRGLPSAEAKDAEDKPDANLGGIPFPGPVPIPFPFGRRRAEAEFADSEADLWRRADSENVNEADVKDWNPCFLIPCPPDAEVKETSDFETSELGRVPHPAGRRAEVEDEGSLNHFHPGGPPVQGAEVYDATSEGHSTREPATEEMRRALSLRSPRPYHDTGCNTAWDCKGKSVYCYMGTRGRPNFCAYGDGVGSLCKNDTGCGWIGQGANARKMQCVMAPRKSSGICLDPWDQKYIGGRRLEN